MQAIWNRVGRPRSATWSGPADWGPAAGRAPAAARAIPAIPAAAAVVPSQARRCKVPASGAVLSGIGSPPPWPMASGGNSPLATLGSDEARLPRDGDLGDGGLGVPIV